MIKNIIFDMGNVLLKYDPEVCLCHYMDHEEDRAVIRKELFEGPEWEQGDLGLLTDLERYDKVKERVPERLHEALKNCALFWTMCMKPVKGAQKFCQVAKDMGYRIYILSNASSSFYDYFSDFAPLDYFDGSVVSCDIHIVKPDIRIYGHLCEKYNLLPEECFFIDDRKENVEAAKAFGMSGAVFGGDYEYVKGCLSMEGVRENLKGDADETYKSFNKSLVPGETAPMLGVRLPRLRAIAKGLAKEKGRNYIQAVMKVEKCGEVYHEELLIHGILIGYLTCGIEERKRLLEEFIPFIDNWSVCDSSCMTYKFMRKDPEEWFFFLQNYATSDKEYEIRFAVVCMLDHFVTEEFLERLFQTFDAIRHEGYYVKMAVAWAVSVCYVKFPEETRVFLRNNKMDDFTQNKSIQKIRESFRVSKENKEALLKWKR